MPKRKAADGDYDGMSVDELDALIIDLSNEAATLRERQLAATAAYDKAAHAATAERVASSLSEPERAALAQRLAVDGAVGSEASGTPKGDV